MKKEGVMHTGWKGGGGGGRSGMRFGESRGQGGRGREGGRKGSRGVDIYVFLLVPGQLLLYGDKKSS